MTRVIKNPDGSVDYQWDGSETELEKEAIREYGVQQASEIPDAIAWRDALDAMDDQQLARVLRGKHPKEDKEIPRPQPRGPPGRS